jgi:hypothetical protein
MRLIHDDITGGGIDDDGRKKGCSRERGTGRGRRGVVGF